MIPLTNDIIELSIYADYLEDQGKYNEAIYLREELQEIPDEDEDWYWYYRCFLVGGCSVNVIGIGGGVGVIGIIGGASWGSDTVGSPGENSVGN